MTDATRTNVPNPDATRTSAPETPPDGGPVRPPDLDGPAFDFVLGEELGRGAMGVVYRATQPGLNRTVAVKVLPDGADDPRQVIRFLAEAEAVAALRHPHVVQVFGFGRHRGRPYLALEYCDGGTLHDRIRRGPLAPRDAATILAKLADAAHAAHALGIVHRDIKPSNVLFDTGGEPKLADFGLAKRGGGADLTRTQAVMGTPAYMAPEQARGQARFVGPAADVYALGVVLYESLCGRRPFESDDTLSLLRMVSEDEAEPLARRAPGIPRDLGLIARRCMEKDPAKRYATAAALAADLRAFSAGEPVTARPPGTIEHAVRWVRKHPTATAAAGLLTAGAAAFVAATVAHNRELEKALADTTEQARIARENGEEADRQKQRVAAAAKGRQADLDRIVANAALRLKGNAVFHAEFLAQVVAANEKMLGDSPDDRGLTAAMAKRYADLAASEAAAGYVEAERSYLRAAALYDRAAALDPGRAADFAYDRGDARFDLAKYLAGRGEYARAKALNEAAAADFAAAAKPRAPVRAALARFNAAWTRAETDPAADLLPDLRPPLAALEAFADAHPADAEAQVYAARAGRLAALFAAHRNHPDADALFRRALDFGRRAKARDGAAYGNVYSSPLALAHIDWEAYLSERKRPDDLLAAAELFEKDFPETYSGSWYAALRACHAARCRAPGPACDAARAAAVEYLKRSVAKGFSTRGWYSENEEFGVLKGFPPYAAFLADLDRRFANGKPPSAGERFAAVQAIRTENAAWYAAPAERVPAEDRLRPKGFRTPSTWHLQKAVQVKDDVPDGTDELAAAAWVVGTADPKLRPDEKPFLLTALARLRREPGTSAVYSSTYQLAKVAEPLAFDILEAAAEKQAEVEGRAYALYYAAMWLSNRGEEAPFGSAEQAKLFDRAAVLFRRVAAEYGTVEFGENRQVFSVPSLAAAKNCEMFMTGRTIPDIRGKDFDGVEFRLSDYRGKVVLLDIWANWCPPCRKMYPLLRELHRDCAGRPLAVVGINADEPEDVPNARQVLAENGLTWWRSWADGRSGPITEAWGITAYPQTFLLDDRGRVLKRWEGYSEKTTDQIRKAVTEALDRVPAARSN